jgi:RNA-directed DNA polymerase
VLRGWTTYFRHGSSKATLSYLWHYTWLRVMRWLRHKHPKPNWKQLRRRYLPGWWPTDGETTLFHPEHVAIQYYSYRGNRIASPWTTTTTANT